MGGILEELEEGKIMIKIYCKKINLIKKEGLLSLLSPLWLWKGTELLNEQGHSD